MDRADGKAGAQFRLWLPLATGGEGSVVDTTVQAPVTILGRQ